MGLGKHISIIVDPTYDLTIFYDLVSPKMQVYCPDRDNLVKILLKEARGLKIPIYSSIEDFKKKNSDKSGNFDLELYKSNIGGRLLDEDMLEAQYSHRTSQLGDKMKLLSSPEYKPIFNQNKYNKMGKQKSYREKTQSSYIRSPRDSSKLEHIFRRFTHVNRSIEDELRYIKPHRTRPTLFAQFPYRVITKHNMDSIAPSKIPLPSTGKYKTFNISITMLMAYEWGLILHYLTASQEDRQKVKEMIYDNENELKKKLGGYKDNIGKILNLYYQYKQFLDQGKFNLLSISNIRKIIAGQPINQEYNTHRPYSETEILTDFVNTLRQEVIQLNLSEKKQYTDNTINEYIIHLCSCINDSRLVLFDHIKKYYPANLNV
jgi:hypothetical protein